jgi:outer membrane protein OmpA-like peptidoglycan-associated protein
MKKQFLILFLLLPFAAQSFAGTEYEFLSDSINNVAPVKLGQKLTIPGFYFDSGSVSINVNLKDYIAKIAGQIKKVKYKKIYVDGYTDNSGNNSSNNKLSRARAQGVRKELIANGISAKRIQARAYGSSNPIAGNDTAAGRVINRRIEIIIK